METRCLTIRFTGCFSNPVNAHIWKWGLRADVFKTYPIDELNKAPPAPCMPLHTGGILDIVKMHKPQATFNPWIISGKPGLFPYININNLKIFIERKSPTITDSANTVILVTICQAGISDTPNLSIV
jgi:hypothetical protein